MKITIQIIRDEFGGDVEETFIRSSPNTAIVEMVSLFEPELKTEPDKIYIVRKKEIDILTAEERKGSFLILLGGAKNRLPLYEEKREALQNMGNDMILLRNGNTASVLRKVQALLEVYHKWEIELYKTAACRKRVRDIAMTAASLIDNPVFLYSTSLKLIFYCNLTDAAESFFHEVEDYATQHEGEYITETFMDKLCKSPIQKLTTLKNDPVVSDSETLGYRTLSYNIFLNDIYVARALICEVEHPLRDSDFFVLKTLGDFLAPYLGSQDMDMNTHPANFDKYLHQLLAGNPVEDPALLSSVLATYGWDEKDTYLCCCIPIDADRLTVDSVMTTCFFLEKEYPNSALLTYSNHIVHIINLSFVRNSQKHIVQNLQNLYHHRGLRAGVSPVFIGLGQLNERYKQAEAAYYIGTKDDPDREIYMYEDYKLKDMMQIIKKEYSIEVVCPIEVAKLMEYDHNRNMNLTKTLRTYLENDRNIAKSIRVLYMQRPTFLYQLNRIMEITGLKLDDYNCRLYLQLYFAASGTQES